MGRGGFARVRLFLFRLAEFLHNNADILDLGVLANGDAGFFGADVESTDGTARDVAEFLGVGEAQGEGSGGLDVLVHLVGEDGVFVAELGSLVGNEHRAGAHVVVGVEQGASGALRGGEELVEDVAVGFAASDDAVGVFVDSEAAPRRERFGVPDGRDVFVAEQVADSRGVGVFAEDAAGRGLRDRFEPERLAPVGNELDAASPGERLHLLAVEGSLDFHIGAREGLGAEGAQELAP